MTEDAGSALAFQLLYSGNFEGFVQKNQLNEVRVGLGINPENFSWELAPNQSFDTPVAMISYSHEGLTGLSQESQAFVQDHIIPSLAIKNVQFLSTTGKQPTLILRKKNYWS